MYMAAVACRLALNVLALCCHLRGVNAPDGQFRSRAHLRVNKAHNCQIAIGMESVYHFTDLGNAMRPRNHQVGPHASAIVRKVEGFRARAA